MTTPLKTSTSQSSVEKHPRDNDPFSLFQRSVHLILESINLNGLAFSIGIAILVFLSLKLAFNKFIRSPVTDWSSVVLHIYPAFRDF